MTPNLTRISRVFDCDSANIGPIANLKAGGERAHKIAQFTYWSCHDTIRTQIVNWSQTCGVEMPGFGGKTGPLAMVRVFVWWNPLQQFGSGSEPDPEPTWEYGTVANTTGDVKAQVHLSQSHTDSRHQNRRHSHPKHQLIDLVTMRQLMYPKSNVCHLDMCIYIHLFPVLNFSIMMHMPRIARVIMMSIQICWLMKEHPLVSRLSAAWWLVLATGPGNPPAVWVWTAKMGRFRYRPVQ